MAMNPQNVLSSLRMMSDQQLQQYAAMHKNDPFIFPLAFQESQTRKQMRAESQQAQMAPQPKVADQALASMAATPMPEEVGIGQLPAKNMEGMAAGGIVAFDEGGEVPRYQGLNESLVRLPPSANSLYGIPGMQLQGSFIPQQGTVDDRTLYEKLKGYNPRMSKGTKEQLEMAAFDDATRRFQQERDAKQQAVASAIKGSTTAAPTAAPPSDNKYAPTYPSSTGMRLGSNLGLTATPALTTTATGTIQELQAMQDQLGQPTVPQAQLDAIEKYRSGKEADLKAGLAELEADQAKQGLGMEGAETRAKAREAKLTAREGDLAGMALFEAGMAIMAGESPYALTNIGKGAGIGMKSYTAGLEKLQESRDKLDESFDKIEQFRMNRADMNAREVRAAKKDIRATQAEADRLGLDALMKDFDMKRADARAGFQVLAQNRATMYEVASREKLGLAQIQAHKDVAASQPDRVLWESLLRQNNNDPAAAYQALTKLKTEKFNPYQSYADYLKAFAGKENVLTPPMGFVQYAQQFNVPSYTGSSIPENAATRPPIK